MGEQNIVITKDAAAAEPIDGRITTAENEIEPKERSVADRLLTVKSLTTLSMTATFMFLAVKGSIAPDQFMTVFTTVIAFYFGVQTVKNKE